MLTKLEVLNITETIDKAEISFSHLRDELIDHICCEIEYQMEKGFNFQDAFENIKPKVGIRDLQKVQEGTLLLIDKKYRMMKRLMKISGVLSLVGLIVGSLLRVYHLPGANIVMAFGFLVLCVLFLPSSISIMRKENKASSKIMLYVSAYIGSIGFSLGIFFKLMHWPGAGYVITIGIVILSFMFLPFLWFTLRKQITSKTEKLAVLTGIIGGSLHLIGVLFKMQHWPSATSIFVISVVLLIFIFLPLYTYTKFKSDVHVNEKFIYIIYAFTFSVLLTSLLQFRFAFDSAKVFMADISARISVANFNANSLNWPQVISKDSIYQAKLKAIIVKLKETDEIIDSVNKEFITSLAPKISYDKYNTTLNCILLLNNSNGNILEYVTLGNGENSPTFRIKRNVEDLLSRIADLGLTNEKYSILKVLLNTSVSIDESKELFEDFPFSNKEPFFQYQVLLGLQQRLALAEKELSL